MIRLFISFFTLAALFILPGCFAKKDSSVKTSPEVKVVKKNSFTVVKVITDQPEFSITLPGELLPYEQVNIYPKMKAFIKKIYVDRGTLVKKGQLLALLEAPEIGDQYASRQSATNTARQKYLFSKQSYERLAEASKKHGAVATIELEKAYAQFLGDSAAFKSSLAEASASGQLNNYLRITAPFSGIITERFVSEGALVGENAHGNEPLFQLSQQNKLRLTAGIPEKDASSLKDGTKAVFTVVDYPGKTFEANLSRHSGSLDMSSRSVIAEFDVPNASLELKAGQYARVALTLQRSHPTLWVPASGIVRSQSGVFVVRVSNNTPVRVPVQTGGVLKGLTEVFGDLREGDTILEKGSEEIEEGVQLLTQMK